MNYHECLQNLGYVNYPIFFSYTYSNNDEKNVREDSENDFQEVEKEVACNEVDTINDVIITQKELVEEIDSRATASIIPIEKKATLELIKKSVGDELEDEAFYSFLITHAPNDEQRRIIASIRDDERKHNRLLRELYFDLTGERLPQDVLTEMPNFSISYMQGLENALMGELDAVTRYQTLLKGLTTMDHHNTVLEILTDELRHANKYNYLITKNSL